MSSILLDQISKSRGLLGALEGITNRKAFVAAAVTVLGSAILLAVFSALGTTLLYNGQYQTSKIVAGVGFLVVAAAFVIGMSATGFLVNDLVRGRQQGSVANSFLLAVATLPRVIGVLLVVVAIGLLLLVGDALLLFLCKLPGVGPLLYAAVAPLSVVVMAIAFFASLFVVMLHGPAIWEGNTVMRTVAILGAISRERLLAVIVQSSLLYLLVAFIGAIVTSGLMVGSSVTAGLSIPIIGQDLQFGTRMFDALLGGFLGGGGSGAGYLKAAMFGASILAGIGFIVPLLVMMSGSCIIYANVTVQLVGAAKVEQSIQDAIDVAREKAESAKRKLEESRDQLTASAATAAATSCGKCNTPTAVGDAFCGNCGTALR